MRYLKNTLILAGAAALVIGGILSPVSAQTTTKEIIQALTPLKTRSLSTSDQPAPNPQAEAFINSVRAQSNRSLSAAEREQLTAITADKASANIPIQFSYGSNVIKGASLRLADELGRALTSPEFKGNTFIIAGHTDAKGSDEVNNPLSEQRARAVKTYLVKKFSIDPLTLITVGYGKTRLKNKDQPLAPENRRVEVINALASTAAR
jgi:outer membrane protein OmpA-like peptidoglycan-associated protein